MVTVIIDNAEATFSNGEWATASPDLLSRIYKVMQPEWEYEDDATLVDNVVKALSQPPTQQLSMIIAKSAPEHRYTFSVVYKASPSMAKGSEGLVLDAHREYITDTDLFDALHGYVESGDRNIYIQHQLTPQYGSQSAGKWTQLVQWPYPVPAKVNYPNGVEKAAMIPANSVFMGVVWEPWSWQLVKAGKIRGLSLGGTARRLPFG
jgi:hypothetical protein